MNVDIVLTRMWGNEEIGNALFEKFTKSTKAVDWDLLYNTDRSESRKENGVVLLDVHDLDGKVPYKFGLKVYRDGCTKPDPENPLHIIWRATRDLCRYPLIAEYFKEQGVMYISSYFASNVDAIYFSDEYLKNYM